MIKKIFKLYWRLLLIQWRILSFPFRVWRKRRLTRALRIVARALDYCKSNHGLGLISVDNKRIRVVCQKIELYAKL